MQTLHSPSRFKVLYYNPGRTFLSFFSAVPSLVPTHSATPSSNPLISHYLIESFAFSEQHALSISKRFPGIKTIEKPQSVVQFLEQLGFSNTQIRSSVRLTPQILFSGIDKTLKPKLQFFQDLGLSGPDLGKFISKNSMLLTRSLKKKLIPCIYIIKKTLVNDKNNQDLILVLRRCNWIIAKEPESRLTCNIAFLESCGIIGSQLSMLLKRQPWLFAMRETSLRNLVSRVLDMGFSIHSRMLVHAIYTVSCMSGETLSRKFDVFSSFGFSMDECMGMFTKTPGLLRTSEDKLKLGIDFFLNDAKLERSALVRRPNCLMHSMEHRVIPRYRVLQVMKSKRLLQKDPSFVYILNLSEEKFLRKLSRCRDGAEELFETYKADLLDS